MYKRQLHALSADAPLRSQAVGGATCHLHQETARGAALCLRQAAATLPVHLERTSRRASVSSYTDRAKPSRSTQRPSVLRRGAVPQATGRGYIAWRTLAERLSTSDMQPSSCTAPRAPASFRPIASSPRSRRRASARARNASPIHGRENESRESDFATGEPIVSPVALFREEVPCLAPQATHALELLPLRYGLLLH